MRVTLDWSYELLDDDERLVFARIGVSGSFDLAAAEAVITGAPLDSDVLEVLGALSNKSMVVADTNSHTPFRLLGATSAYAVDQLAATCEEAESRPTTRRLLRRPLLAARRRVWKDPTRSQRRDVSMLPVPRARRFR